MPVSPETDKLVRDLQAQHDRIEAHRNRTMRYYDDAPDGHAKKREALAKLHELGDRLAAVDKQLDEASDRWIAESEEPEVPVYSVAKTTDEFGQDRWFVADAQQDWVEGPFDTVEHASQVARRLAAENAS